MPRSRQAEPAEHAGPAVRSRRQRRARREAEAFEAEPFALAALAVRGWDDGGKVAGVEIPSVEYWRPLLEDPGLRR